jgi:hypothetical protein
MPKPQFVTRVTSVGRKATGKGKKEKGRSETWDKVKTWTLGTVGTVGAGAIARHTYNSERDKSSTRQRAPGPHPHQSGPGPLASQRSYKSVL